jgi:hypothetical protein
VNRSREKERLLRQLPSTTPCFSSWWLSLSACLLSLVLYQSSVISSCYAVPVYRPRPDAGCSNECSSHECSAGQLAEEVVASGLPLFGPSGAGNCSHGCSGRSLFRLQRGFFGPSGAGDCSHGCSAAQPVEAIVMPPTLPRRGRGFVHRRVRSVEDILLVEFNAMGAEDAK